MAVVRLFRSRVASRRSGQEPSGRCRKAGPRRRPGRRPGPSRHRERTAYCPRWPRPPDMHHAGGCLARRVDRLATQCPDLAGVAVVEQPVALRPVGLELGAFVENLAEPVLHQGDVAPDADPATPLLPVAGRGGQGIGVDIGLDQSFDLGTLVLHLGDHLVRGVIAADSVARGAAAAVADADAAPSIASAQEAPQNARAPQNVPAQRPSAAPPPVGSGHRYPATPEV